jgi:hypothetical protein
MRISSWIGCRKNGLFLCLLRAIFALYGGKIIFLTAKGAKVFAKSAKKIILTTTD